MDNNICPGPGKSVPNGQIIWEQGFEAGLAQGKSERPQGEWIKEGTEIGAFGIKFTWNKCNKCGWSSNLIIPKNFCPNCGADMRGGKK